MKYSPYLAVITTLFVMVNSETVFQLTDNDFDQYIKDKEAMLVDFYAPWCSDCKRLEPKYEQAAMMLGAKKKFVLAKVDCFGTGIATCGKFGVRSWPQVKLFKYGKYEGEYHGAEDANAISAFMDGLVNQPEASPVSSAQNIAQQFVQPQPQTPPAAPFPAPNYYATG